MGSAGHSPATSEATGTDRAKLGAFKQQRALSERKADGRVVLGPEWK